MFLKPNEGSTPMNVSDFNLNEIEVYLNAVLNVSDDAVFIKNDKCQLVVANDAFCKLFEVSREDVIGNAFSGKKGAVEHAICLSQENSVLSSGVEYSSETSLVLPSGKSIAVATKKTRLTDSHGRHFLVGVIHDITKRKQTELREKTRTHVLELITRGEPLTLILQAIVEIVEQHNPEMKCSVLLLDDSGKHLLSGAAASLPDFFNKAIHGLSIGIGVGSCGTAAFINERVIVADIQTHPYWADYKELAKSANLHACWSEPIRSSQGTVLGTFAIYHSKINHPSASDLSLIEQTANLASIAIEKSRSEETLKRAASVFTHANEGIIITDASATIIEVNDTFTRITGYTHEEVLGKNPRIIQSSRQSKEFYSQMWSSLEKNGHWRGEIWNRRKNGEIYPEMLTISAVKDEGGVVQQYVSLSTDITEMKNYQEKLERIAHYDLLTNLPNRVLLEKKLNEAIAHSNNQGNSLAVAFMDLDGFKAINDTYGHDKGDQFLVQVSKGLIGTLREGDTLARIGGDEFVIIMADLERFEDCELVLNRLLVSASAPVNLADSIVKVSASIGVTVYPQDKVDADQLIRHADQAMYIAKQAGKNRFHQFDWELDNAVNSQHRTIDNVRSALLRGDFVLHYQPKVNMQTGDVIGVEALIRWEHPEKGLIPPLDFLPTIEGHMVSLQVGEWVISEALRQAAAWRKEGIYLPISVNICAYQLQQENFTGRLASILAKYDEIEASLLELEILETSALQDTHQVSATMKACQALGVRFALDDFGTGYSSLTYLKRLPAYLIKIDQSFVRDMLEDKDDLAIVEGVVGLASTFDRDVIAEGVESVEHGVALIKLGCCLAQGFGIARPMPSEMIAKWVKSWRADDAWLSSSQGT